MRSIHSFWSFFILGQLISFVFAFSKIDSDYLSPQRTRQLYCAYEILGNDYGIPALQHLKQQKESDNVDDDDIDLSVLNATIIDYWRRRHFIKYKLDGQTEIIDRWVFTTYASSHKDTVIGQAMEFCSRDPIAGFGIIFVQLASRAFNCVFQQVLQNCEQRSASIISKD